MSSRLRRVTMIAGVCALLVACGDTTSSAPTSTAGPSSTVVATTVPITTTVATTVPVTTAPPTTAPPTTAPVEQVVVATYFARNGLLVAGSRKVAKADAARAAIAAVVEGPNGAERTAGFTTAIPTGTGLRSVTIANRRAEVDLSGAFTTGGGSLSIRLRVAQIVYTLVRSGAVDSVRFLIDGQRVEAIGGEGFIVTDVKIGEFDDLLPPIVIEFPTPGASVASPLVFKGLANVFEGQVDFELFDSRSVLLTKGYAMGMMGAWGQFATTVPFSAVGPLELRVFTISAKDGSRRDESSIPFTAT